MIRKSLALLSFALLLSLQPIGTNPARAEDPVTLSDLSPGAELAYWNKIKESGDAADFATYLQNFPNGMFYDLALEKFQGLGGNPSDLRNVPVAVPSEPPADVQPVTPKRKIVKLTSKKVVKRKSTKRVAIKRTRKIVCPVTRRLVGNSCQIVVRKVKVVKPKPIRVAKKLSKKKVTPIVRDGGGGGGGGGGGAWK